MRICMDNMPERGVDTLNAWESKMLYNQEDFDPKEKKFTKDLYLSTLICETQIYPILFCSTPLFILGNKK